MSSLRTHIVIPARYASSRYPGKPLARIRGAGGTERTLIERSWRAACAIPGIERVVVATDDQRIAEEARRFGADVAITPADCRNGTERCAATIAQLETPPDMVVNFQGDAPLTPDWVVGKLVERMVADPRLSVCTPAVTCSPSLLDTLLADQAAGRVGGTTVVFDADLDALYFSKRVIPYVPVGQAAAASAEVHMHMGVYAYRPEALSAYVTTSPSRLEELEGLEQLRFLHCGIRIGIVLCRSPDWDVIELNNPEDLPLIEAILEARGID